MDCRFTSKFKQNQFLQLLEGYIKAEKVNPLSPKGFPIDE